MNIFNKEVGGQIAKILALGLFFLIIIVGYSEYRMQASIPFIESDMSKLPRDQVVVVFGGGMDVPGVQSADQKDRVTTGVDLYKQGIARRIIMSGDDGSKRDNEVDYMRAQAAYQGVPLYVIEMDGKGYRTYETCRRLKERFGHDRIVAVSQEYHLKRIIYLCSAFGVETIGVPADIYLGKKSRSHLREPFARVKAVLDVFVLEMGE